MLKSLEERAAALDRAPVTVLNPATGAFETLDGTVVPDDAPPPPEAARAPVPPSEAMPLALRQYTQARQAADLAGAASFVHNGATYVRKADGKGWSARAAPPGRPCGRYRDDPAGATRRPAAATHRARRSRTARRATRRTRPPSRADRGARRRGPRALGPRGAPGGPRAAARCAPATGLVPLVPVSFAGAKPIA